MTEAFPQNDDSPSTADAQWMDIALELAQKAEALGEVPVGALVVKEGVIIGQGWNQPISGCDPTAHAEIMALRQAAQTEQNYRLPGATLYVTIEPCTMCAGAIVHSRISRVVFAATEPKAGAVVSHSHVFDGSGMNHHVEYLAGVRAEAATAQIRAFFQRRRKEKKAAKRLNTPGTL